MRCFFIEPTKSPLLTVTLQSLTDRVTFNWGVFNLTVFGLIGLTLLLGLNLSINLLNNNK